MAQDWRPRRNGALSAIVAMTGSSRLLLVSPRTMPSPNLIWGAAELTDLLNEIGATRISRSQVCGLVTNGDLPKRRQVGEVAYSKRAIRVHVARITVDGSMTQPDARGNVGDRRNRQPRRKLMKWTADRPVAMLGFVSALSEKML